MILPLLSPGPKDVFDKIKERAEGGKRTTHKETLLIKKKTISLSAIDIIQGIRIYQEMNKNI